MGKFCAAVPMSAALGVAATAKQGEKRKQTILQAKPVQAIFFPIGKVSLVIAGGLVAVSVVYHLVLMPRIGMIL